METIPLTVVDDFLPDPDKWREYALSCDYYSDPDGKWPGERSRDLRLIDTVLYNKLCVRFFSLFFDPKAHNLHFEVQANFQKIKRTQDVGWIHTDNPSMASGIVYLNKNPNIENGTSLYKPKDIRTTNIHLDKKVDSYLGKISHQESLKYCLENNDQYIETSRIGNQYNRLVAFDSSCYHGANLSDIPESEERLTLVFFVMKLGLERSPMLRMRMEY